MLSQMLTPGVQPEQFEESFGLLRILVQSPSSGSVSQAALAKLAHHQPKALRSFPEPHEYSMAHEDRTIVEIRLKIRMGFGPVRRWPQVDRFVDDKREETNEDQPGDETDSGDGKAFRSADNSRQPAPQARRQTQAHPERPADRTPALGRAPSRERRSARRR